jgi:hypothetical protein
VTSRPARNTLLAVAAGFAVYATILGSIRSTAELSSLVSFPGFVDVKIAYGFRVLASFAAVAAFAVAVAAFLRYARAARTMALAVSACLFAASGVAGAVAGALVIAQAGGSDQWAFTVSDYADAVGYGVLACTSALVALAVRAQLPERALGLASFGLALYYSALSATLAFGLVASGEGGRVAGNITAGLVLAACGEAVAAAAAVVAAFAFLSAAARRRRGIAWAAAREGLLGTAATVFAVGFLVGAIGLLITAGSGGEAPGGGEEWLQGATYLGLSIAAACSAVAFRLSSRAATAAVAC